MDSDPPPASLATIAAAAERLRMELLDALCCAFVKAERAAVVTELVMLYGQAFRQVYDACLWQPSPEPRTVRVMHECICGLAVYNVWQIADTPLDAPDDYARMTAHWGAVTRWLLTDDD